MATKRNGTATNGHRMPYHIGGVIEREASLLVASEHTFREQFAIDTRTNCEAVSIDAEAKTVNLRNVETGDVTTEFISQAGPVARCQIGAAAAAGDRPAGHHHHGRLHQVDSLSKRRDVLIKQTVSRSPCQDL